MMPSLASETKVFSDKVTKKLSHCLRSDYSGVPTAHALSHFNFLLKFCFQYQLWGRGLENNFGPSVKQSDEKN